LFRPKRRRPYKTARLRKVSNYIEQNRKRLSQETIYNLISTFGSFLGEAIKHQFGGAWKQINGQWAIVFNERNACFPFNKTGKQFANGNEGGDSISSFYNAVPCLLAKKRKPALW